MKAVKTGPARVLWVGLWTAGWILAGMLPAGAAILALNPPEGTVGSEFTITGSEFARNGKVYLGEQRLKVRDWSDTAITVKIMDPQPAGDYTVTVDPNGSKKKVSTQTFAPFTMQPPIIDEGEPMRLIAPMEMVTITGQFFGDEQGRVGMRDTTGLTLECKVLAWSMNSITFQIPEGLTGTVILGVKNEVGVGIQRFWGTFTPVPDVAKATRTWFIKETHDNASGVFFDGQFWIFSPEKDLAIDKNNDVLAWRFDSTTGSLIDVGDPGGTTDAQLAPIVIDHEMWLFLTGENGGLYYKKRTITYNEDTKQYEAKWEDSYHRIGTYTTEHEREIAPVWIAKQGRLELYFYKDNGIQRMYTDDKGVTWSTPAPVAGLGTVASAPSAVYWVKDDGTGATLLTFCGPTTPDTADATHNYTKMYALVDGVVQGTQPMAWSPSSTGKPFIAHLGEDYIGVVFRNGSTGNIDLAKFNKHTQVWNYNPLVPIVASDNKRNPNLAVNMEEHPDTEDPNALGSRYDAVAYVFWGADRGAIGTAAYMSSVELLGYWKEDGQTDVDTAATSARTDMFDLWQVVGVVDAPPFVLNGSPYAEECDLWTCNSLTFGTASGSATTVGWEVTAGIYFETGDKSPVKAELTWTVGQKHEETNKKTVEITTTLFRSKEGAVSVFYLAPKVRTHHTQWYDMTGIPTGNFMNTMQIVDAQLLSMEFDPRGFPWPDLHSMPAKYFGPGVKMHASEDETATGDWARLGTYNMAVPASDYIWFTNSIYWNRLAEKHLKWTESTEATDTFETKVDFKLGTNVGEYFGAGIQGSFGWNTKTTVTVENHSELALIPGSSVGRPFYSFRVDAYWLVPKKDEEAYWVPLNRTGRGDEPWFITYKVSDITTVP